MISRRRNLIILTAVLSVELAILIYQVHRDSDLPLLRQLPILTVTPIERGVHAITNGTWNLWQNYVYLRGARRENEQLNRELNEIKLDNQQLLSQAQQGRRLQALLQFQEQLPSQTIAAQVISSGGTDIARLLVLDKGHEAGLRPDMGVITPDGVVGKILRVFRNASQVLLITDSHSGIAGLLESSRLHGIVRGQNKTLCTVGYILNDDKVEVGDRVLTSGEDHIYPKGLPVGVVVEAHPGVMFQEISLQPYAKLNRLEEVLVITNKIDIELPEAAGTTNSNGGFPTAVPAIDGSSAEPEKRGADAAGAAPAPRKPPPVISPPAIVPGRVP